jgi:hypothetical protein
VQALVLARIGRFLPHCIHGQTTAVEIPSANPWAIT